MHTIKKILMFFLFSKNTVMKVVRGLILIACSAFGFAYYKEVILQILSALVVVLYVINLVLVKVERIISMRGLKNMQLLKTVNENNKDEIFNILEKDADNTHKLRLLCSRYDFFFYFYCSLFFVFLFLSKFSGYKSCFFIN